MPPFVSMKPCLFPLDVHHQGHGRHYSVQHATGHYCRDSTISTGQLRVSQHGSVSFNKLKGNRARCWNSCKLWVCETSLIDISHETYSFTHTTPLKQLHGNN